MLNTLLSIKVSSKIKVPLLLILCWVPKEELRPQLQLEGFSPCTCSHPN